MKLSSNRLSIPLFQRRRIATRDFFIGLFSAIVFHVLLLLLFQIAPLYTPEDIPPLPVIQVQAELSSQKKSILPAKSAPLSLFSKKRANLDELSFPESFDEMKKLEDAHFDQPSNPIEKLPYMPVAANDF